MDENEQLDMFKSRRGGKRAGAGRKPKVKGRPGVPHRPREIHRKWDPEHVTMKVVRGVKNLRSRDVCKVIFKCFRDRIKKANAAFRVIHFSVQWDHLHLIVEAEDDDAFSDGMRSLAISLGKRVNNHLGRRGRLFAHRFRSRALTSPREVRNCILYVLQNAAHHGEARCRDGLDRPSSAFWSDVWITPPPKLDLDSPVHEPTVFLLTTGWLKHGRLARHEVPA
jgi:REP element-mobilizing transposase RayT